MNPRLAKGAALAAVIALSIGVAKALAHDAEAVSRPSDRRRGRLGLSHEQREKLRAAGRERRDAVRPLRQELRDQSRLLREELQKGATDKELEATMAKISVLRKEIAAKNDEFRAKADALLTPRQRAQLALGMRRRAHRAWRSRHERFSGEGRSSWQR